MGFDGRMIPCHVSCAYWVRWELVCRIGALSPIPTTGGGRALLRARVASEASEESWDSFEVCIASGLNIFDPPSFEGHRFWVKSPEPCLLVVFTVWSLLSLVHFLEARSVMYP